MIPPPAIFFWGKSTLLRAQLGFWSTWLGAHFFWVSAFCSSHLIAAKHQQNTISVCFFGDVGKKCFFRTKMGAFKYDFFTNLHQIDHFTMPRSRWCGIGIFVGPPTVKWMFGRNHPDFFVIFSMHPAADSALCSWPGETALIKARCIALAGMFHTSWCWNKL